LKIPAIAELVVCAFDLGCARFDRYVLYAYVIMSNHIHVLFAPKVSVRVITQSVKGVTAREANRILGRTGQKFWQDESFDHWVRTEAEFMQIKQYIEQNPVNANLVQRPDEWPWSSATAGS
jgi:REP element-mobilizing transposase RayT